MHDYEMRGVSRFLIAGGILGVLVFCLTYSVTSGSLIASSEVQMCSRNSREVEPIHASGEHCSKKFVISLAVRNGQVSKNQLYSRYVIDLSP